MRKGGFSLGLIIVSNVLIIIISLVYGLRIIPSPNEHQVISNETADEFRDLTIQTQT